MRGRSHLKIPSQSSLCTFRNTIDNVHSVSGANTIAQELGKSVSHEIVLVSPQMRGQTTGSTEIYVQTVSEDGLSFYATKDDFMNRKFIMQEMHQDFVDGENDWDKPFEQDPFYNPSSDATILGFANVYIAR